MLLGWEENTVTKKLEELIEFLDYKTRNLRWKLFDIRLWFRYRITERYNVLKIRSLEPAFYEANDLLLHASMQIVVDFVEINKANVERGMWGYGDNISWIRKYLPRILRPFFYTKRSREAGLKYLDWEIALPRENVLDEKGNIVEYACPGQSEAAETLKEIYLWWKDVYPNRPDPLDASGFSAFCDYEIEKYGDLFRTEPCKWDEDGNPTLFKIKDDLTEEEEAERSRTLNKCREIEQAYLKEEEEMLIKLAKIRPGLWT